MKAIPLRQSTAKIVTIGPFVDVTDGYTPETGITLGAADSAKIIKAAAGAGVSIAGNTWAHVTDGVYNLSLTASDTDTLGPLLALVRDDSVCRGPVTQQFVVLPAEVYDSLVAGTDLLQVDAQQIDGDATAATNIAKAANTMVPFVVQASSTTSVVNTDLTEGTDDHYIGRTVAFITGALAGQSAPIADYNGTSKALTVETMTEAPAAADLAVIY